MGFLLTAENPAGAAVFDVFRQDLDWIRFDFSPIDDEMDPVGRAMAAVRLPGVVGVVGHASSRSSLAAAFVYEDAEVPLVVPTGTSRLLGESGWLFPLAPNDSIEGAFLGRYIDQVLGAESAALLYLPEEYGYGIREGVAHEIERRGLALLHANVLPAIGLGFDPGDFDALTEALLTAGVPDVVVLATRQAEAYEIVSRLAPQLPRTIFVGADGILRDTTILKLEPEALDRLHLVSFWNPERETRWAERLREAFRARGAEPDTYSAMSFDAGLALASAVREVGIDREEIAAYLRRLGRELEALEGATGPIAFTPDASAERLVILGARSGGVLWP